MTAVKLEDARRVIIAAEKKAREIGRPMNIGGRRRRKHRSAHSYGQRMDWQH
jgi:hypothetical protein